VRKWLPMIILASAQFVMVLDSSVMNVAISQIVEDLDIVTVETVEQAALDGGLNPDQASAVADDYGDAQGHQEGPQRQAERSTVAFTTF
jgi:hypothetical protein